MAAKGKITDLFDMASIEAQQQKAVSLVQDFINQVDAASQHKIVLKNATNPSDIITGIQNVTAAQKVQNDIVLQSVEGQKKLTKAISDQQAATQKSSKSNKDNADTLTAVDKAKQRLALSESKLTKEAALYNVQASQQNKLNQINATLAAAVPGSLEEAAAKVAKYRNELSILNLTTETGKKRQAELIAAIDEQNKFIDTNSDALARQKINIGNYESAINGLGKAIRGIGGLGRIAGAALGIDPVIGETIHRAGQGLIELAHALSIEKVAKLESAGATTIATGATTAYTVAKTEESATTDVSSVSISGHTVAMEADTVATEEAAAATGIFSKALNFLKDNPVIAIILGLVAAFTAISAVLEDQGDKFKRITEAAKAYAEAVGKAIDATTEAVDVNNKSVKDDAKYYEDLLARETKAGITKERELALTQKFLELNKKVAQNQLDANPNIADQLREQTTLRDQLLKKQQDLSKATSVLSQISFEEAQKSAGLLDRINNKFKIIKPADLAKAFKEASDQNDAALKAADDNVKKLTEIQRAPFDAENELIKNRLAINKLSAEELIKVNLETSRIEVTEQTDKNNLILSNEKSTLTQRLAAIRDNAAQTRKLAQAEETAIVNTPGVSDADKINAQTQLASKLREIDRHSQADQVKETEDYNKKILALDKELSDAQINERIDGDIDLLTSEKSSYFKRLDAAQAFYTDSLAALTANRDYELKLADTLPDDGQRAKKKLAIEQKYNQDLLKLNRTSQSQIEDATKKHLDTLDTIRKTGEDTIILDIQNDFNQQLAAEDANYLKKVNRDKGNFVKLEEDRIEHERNVLNIQFESQKKQLEADIVFAQTQLEIQRELAQAEPDSDKKKQDLANIGKAESALAALRVKLNALVSSHALAANKQQDDGDQSLNDKRIERLQILVDYSKQAYDIIDGFIAASTQKQLNSIDAQIAAIDKKKDKDIEAATQTIANEKDRADAITLINERAQAKEDALNERKRQAQQRQAQFEKAINIAILIEETAIAVIRALGDKTLPGPSRIAEAVIIGALGAARIAVALATPIPQYKMGTEDHPGGLAEVGHGKAEGVITPDGNIYKTPATPTTVNLPKHTVVHPDFDKMMISATLTNIPEFKQQSVSDTAERAMLKVGKDIVGAIKGKRETHLHMPGRYDMYMQQGSKFRAYLKNNL